MTKNEYLKFALAKGYHEHLSWIFAAFSIPKTIAGTVLDFGGNIVAEPWGYSVVFEQGQEPVKLDDAKPGVPLFTFQDDIDIDGTWFPNVTGKISTKIGNVLVNAVCIVPAFGTKVEFITGRFTPSTVEAKISPRLESNPKGDAQDPTRIFVRDYIKFCDRASFLESLTTLACWSATPVSVTPPPGITQYKKELLKEFGKDLAKPEVLSMVEKKLGEYDDKYTDGDEAAIFMKGKFKTTARKKMYQMVGAGLGFKESEKLTPIPKSLDEGWSTSPEDFSAMLNDQRFGSFSRGAETVNGGVAGKMVIRVLSGYSITDNDCGSKLGMPRIADKETQAGYVGRTIIDGTKQVKIETVEQMASYLGKAIRLRSPQTCKAGEHNFCRVCAGENLFRFKDGLVIPGTEITSAILASSMKIMHTSGLKTQELDLADAFSS